MRKLVWGLLTLLVCGVLVLAMSPAAFAGALLVPSYFTPSGPSDQWTTMCDTLGVAQSGSIAILNPDSGPGRSADPGYAAALARCHQDGQRVIGYVPTGYSRAPIATVEEQVDEYYSFYPSLDGIFFDTMSSVPTKKASCKGCAMTVGSYYATLYQFVHDGWSGSTVVANPGTPATTGWQLSTPAADVVVTFEGTAKSFAKYRAPAWALAAPADSVATIVYAARTADLGAECAAIMDDNSGLAYVTDRKGSDPYDALPSYWSAETTGC